jgi:hypothetical protein
MIGWNIEKLEATTLLDPTSSDSDNESFEWPYEELSRVQAVTLLRKHA